MRAPVPQPSRPEREAAAHPVWIETSWVMRRVHQVVLRCAVAAARAGPAGGAGSLAPEVTEILEHELQPLLELMLGEGAPEARTALEQRLACLAPGDAPGAAGGAAERLERERRASGLLRLAAAEICQHSLGGFVGGVPGLCAEQVPAGRQLLSWLTGGCGDRPGKVGEAGTRQGRGTVKRTSAWNGPAVQALVREVLLDLAMRLEARPEARRALQLPGQRRLPAKAYASPPAGAMVDAS